MNLNQSPAPRLDDTAWMTHAACQGEPTDLWFPEKGSTGWDTRTARQVCADCPVKNDCRDYAIDNFIRHGIWGGMTVDERTAYRARRNREKRGAA